MVRSSGREDIAITTEGAAAETLATDSTDNTDGAP
jgi:hypothetical protein